VDNLPPVEDAVATPNPNYTNPPPPSVTDAVADLGNAVVDSVTLSDAAKIAAGWVLVNGILTPPPATRRPYGPLDPVQWGTVGGLVNPGLNPGHIRAPDFYNTTSPIQSKFNWNPKPYQPGPAFNPLTYNSVPNAPAVPWGLQQMQTQYDLNNLIQSINANPGTPRVMAPIAPKV
jgi:hypothetical protein